MGVNMVSAIIALPLLNFFGRKTLMAYSLAFACFFLLIQSITQKFEYTTICLISCMLFIVSFEFGPGPIAWIYMSEVMNEKGVAVGTFINWFFTLFFAVAYPFVYNAIPEK